MNSWVLASACQAPQSRPSPNLSDPPHPNATQVARKFAPVTNSLRLRGREFVRPAQGNVSTLAGNSQGRAGNRQQRRNPDANVSCRSFFGRSFVDGANFDGTIDRIRSWLYKLRLPARFACGF